MNSSDAFSVRLGKILRETGERIDVRLNEIGGKVGALGAFGGSRHVVQLIDAIEKEAISGTEGALAVAAELFPSGGRKRDAALDLVDTKFRTLLDDKMERVDHAAKGLGAWKPPVSQAYARVHDEVEHFRLGWTAPKRRTWLERHPFAEKVIIALVGTVFGAFARNGIDLLRSLATASPPAAASHPAPFNAAADRQVPTSQPQLQPAAAPRPQPRRP